ncbi:alanyl-tRNA synthetase [Kineosphaera limosa]|uniref:Alanine--tRNA ligase n=1 Tax=Kineosphaera limosa NBRC 100340 TaxID=1184609 RepID=K6XC36_9MICO|nr:alanine--tRNA ligase [Kineosphaera limosa]NYD99190.1 alanyl-tRNA synthetase [Kineosphaera limosa]GAB96354.1 alanine--tRNA ligase [Kineosphaera limosa NBRC 100340]
METAEIRRRWLAFFESKGHTVVPSAPLLYDDPNLLFVNAGMVPFKPYFLGQETPPYHRATSVQKCVRTQDIEEVGKTSRHGTFFQMNGNFSFGDYFKAGAIEFAWELLTTHQGAGGYGLEPDKLWVTVYEDDDEAADLWVQLTGIDRGRIVRRDRADNYWSMGVPGPGGPCSEIYVDRGPEYGPDGGPAVDEDRFMEIWNLVFMQHELSAVRSKTDFDIRGDLPNKNIDTGMGLERIASILQGVDNMYEIDEVYPVLERAADLAGKRYGIHSAQDAGHSHPDDVRLRVVADHVRSSLMLIGDGVTPGNEGRGYVLRRMLRRAVRSMRLLGVEQPSLPELLPVSLERMSRSYPELGRDWSRISSIAYAEEDAFRRTLASGTTILDTAVAKAKGSGQQRLGGDDAFALHDTYGFPIDLTLEMAAEQGLAVDEEGFRKLMTEQRERAKADAKIKKQGHTDTHSYRDLADVLGKPVDFTGYLQVEGSGRVAGMLVDGVPADRAGEGDEVELVLDATPFYAEGGGQLADHGLIRVGGGLVDVFDVQKPITGLIVHKGRVAAGEIGVGDVAESSIDVARRRSVSRSHTATHVLHQALRDALSSTATQAGSENSPGRLRFDFSWSKPVPASTFAEIEQHINQVLLDDLPVGAQVMDRKSALESGALAMFGEKYGQEVRVVSIGDWSKELCGGTHAQRVGQLGIVKLLGESSIGSGVRRVEALVGLDAYDHLSTESLIVSRLADTLKARPDELAGRVETLVTRLRDAEKEIAAIKAAQVLSGAAGLVDNAKNLGDTRVVTADAGEVGGDDLRKLVLDVRGRLGDATPAVVAVAGVAKGRPSIVVATNGPARDAGVRAGDLVKAAAGVLGGGGGGKPDLAQGGGTDPAKVADALAEIENRLGVPAGAGG